MVIGGKRKGGCSSLFKLIGFSGELLCFNFFHGRDVYSECGG